MSIPTYSKNLTLTFRKYLAGGILLLVATAFVYRHYVDSVQKFDYQLFDFRERVSWKETPAGIFRFDANKNFDNFLVSQDGWQKFQWDYTVLNPREFNVVYGYNDPGDLYFVYFNQSTGAIVIGETRNGKMNFFKKILYRWQAQVEGRLICDGKTVSIWVNGQELFSHTLEDRHRGGKIGFILNNADNPKTVFIPVNISGTLDSGPSMTYQFLDAAKRKHDFSPSLLVWYAALLALSFYGAWGLKRFVFSNTPLTSVEPRLNFFHVVLIHLGLTVCLFWPFVFLGEVLVSSWDNLGEILPLFYLSKHNFMEILQGKTWGMWNPYSHNGVAFFFNHWNMIYYPLNWPLFFFSDIEVLRALTMRTFIEVFLTGILAYRFFVLELNDRLSALFCSIVYQLCSLLIFTLTIFPTSSLLFVITLYLYLLWSMRSRRATTNYVVMTITFVLLLTSANVAFIFYAMLSLGAISLYRFVSLGRKAKGPTSVALAGLISAVLISAIRVFPSVMGIMDSNRLVDNFSTIHDRFPLITRLFVPEITGWFSSDAFNALVSANLNLISARLDMPSNPQNAFFVYFGIVPALLLLVSIFTKTKGAHRFWKYYAFFVLAMALLWQPIWGIVSILTFPLMHFSYFIIILPVGMCALFGHTILYFKNDPIAHEDIWDRFRIALLLVQAYIVIFVTYLFPELSSWTRVVLLAGIAWWAVSLWGKNQSSSLKNALMGAGLLSITSVAWVLTLLTSTVALIKPLPTKEMWGEWALIPFLHLLLFVLTALVIYVLAQNKVCPRWGRWGLVLVWTVVPVVSVAAVKSSLFSGFLNWTDKFRNYFVDFTLGELKFVLITSIVLLGFALTVGRRRMRPYFLGFLVVLTAADLLMFNSHFDNIVAPSPLYRAFSQLPFPYQDISPEMRHNLDLVNYRVGNMQRVLYANKNLIFKVPSYTGIMGYISKRFHRYLVNFGFPERTILLYPQQTEENDRFLDLSSVRYLFESETNFSVRPGAVPRLALYYDYEAIPDEERLLSRLKDDSFDPLAKVLLNSDLGQDFLREKDRALSMVPLQKIADDRLSALVEAPRTAILVFNESYHPGWKAYADGKPLKILEANFNAMACIIPAGIHQIHWQFEPREFWVFSGMSLVGLGIFLSVCGFGLFRCLTVSNRPEEIKAGHVGSASAFKPRA